MALTTKPLSVPTPEHAPRGWRHVLPRERWHSHRLVLGWTRA